MKVLISTPRQYHSIDLANQLVLNGLKVYLLTLSSSRFANFYKRNKGKKIHSKVKLSSNVLVGFLWYTNVFSEKMLFFLFDVLTVLNLLIVRPQVFIVWSGFTKYSIIVAHKLGIITIVERGSTHIEFQNEILISLGERSISNWLIRRELQNYRECDYIAVPSGYVLNTFNDFKIKCKMFPYGISPLNSKSFDVVHKNLTLDEISILYVGAYSIRKGIDRIKAFLIECSLRYSKVDFVHIGDSNGYSIAVERVSVHELGFVQEELIPNYIANYRFHVAIQLSHEEGLSRVLGEYIRLGIPVIAAQSTGIDGLIYCKPIIFTNPCNSLDILHKKYSAIVSESLLSMNRIHLMSWDIYGKNYSSFLRDLYSTSVNG